MRVLKPKPSASQEARSFAQRFPSLATMDGALNKCKFVSYEFAKHAVRCGYRPVLYHLQHCSDTVYPNPHEKWYGTPRSEWSHYIVVIGGVGYDLTARQFDADASWPTEAAISEFQRTWHTVEVDDFMTAWLQEVTNAESSV